MAILKIQRNLISEELEIAVENFTHSSTLLQIKYLCLRDLSKVQNRNSFGRYF
jgi:hypothetical protein